MNIRAYLYDSKEYIYANTHVPTEMIEMYSILEGYRLKGKKFTIEHGSGATDNKEHELFENDKVSVQYIDKSLIVRGGSPMDEGYIIFDEGAFMITNSEGIIWELSNTMVGDNLVKIKIIGRHEPK